MNYGQITELARFNPETVLRQDTLLLNNHKERGEGKKKLVFSSSLRIPDPSFVGDPQTPYQFAQEMTLSFAFIAGKAFLSVLTILWNSAFKWVYLYFSPLLFASLLFTAICKASSDSHFAFLAFLRPVYQGNRNKSKNKQIGPNQTYKLLYSNGNHK